jgi:galactokinase
MSDFVSTSEDAKVGEIATAFEKQFGRKASTFRAPGRVNLIGEHTDYNDGFVMPAAIGIYSYAAVAPRPDTQVQVHSQNFQETRLLDLNSLAGAPTGHWSDYVRGVAAVLNSAGCSLVGADLLIASDVPIGSGLSSSAALEVSTALALLGVSGISLKRERIALSCQKAENEFTGARCGIMDQFISCFGKAGHALLLDCRSLEHELLPMSHAARIVICNTKIKHSVAGGEYNRRRADCETSVRYLQQFLPGIRALRDVTLAELAEFGQGLQETAFRRCRHVVSENARVQSASAALKRGDLAQFGRLMYDSHRSLRDDYEVSCRELDVMVELASKIDGVFGARMTGGGFGGCTVNLVREDAVENFHSGITREYEARVGIQPDLYICSAAEGAGRI